MADPLFLTLRADAWAAIAAWLTLLVVGLSARLALVQLRDARALREEEARPVVLVDLDIDKHPHMIYVYFQNLGRTTAHNVRLWFDPPLESSVRGPGRVAFFEHIFPTLPPGKRLESFLDTAITRLSEHTTLPTSYVATVTYEDRRGAQYADSYLLDIEAFRGRMYVGKKDIDDVAKALESMSQQLRSWNDPRGAVTAVVLTDEDSDEEDPSQMTGRMQPDVSDHGIHENMQSESERDDLTEAVPDMPSESLEGETGPTGREALHRHST